MITNHPSKYKVLPTVSTNILNICVIHTTDYDERKSICQNGLLFFSIIPSSLQPPLLSRMSPSEIVTNLQPL